MGDNAVGESIGAVRIVLERRRQMVEEGWTHEHDDEHAPGDLTRAAEHYALYASRQLRGYTGEQLTVGMPVSADDGTVKGGYYGWPWDEASWKPSGDPVRNLEKAGALIAAEIDQLLRRRTP